MPDPLRQADVGMLRRLVPIGQSLLEDGRRLDQEQRANGNIVPATLQHAAFLETALDQAHKKLHEITHGVTDMLADLLRHAQSSLP